MNVFNFACRNTGLIEQSTGAGRASSQHMLGLLRDTALLVTQLAASQTSRSCASLRENCEQLTAQFSAGLQQRGYSDDVREDALVAQCGLLDETALRHLSVDDQSQWDSQPLQIELTGRHDAGERVFERLERRMHETSPNVDLLECYAAILAMGFIGRYASPRWNSHVGEGAAKRAALIAALDTQIETLRPTQARPFIVERSARRFADWIYRVSPWAIAGVTCAVAVVVWVLWNTTLDAQLTHLASQTVHP
jgi:type VI secretion system protein ImpK